MSEVRAPARHSQCERILGVLEDGRPHSAAEIHRISGFSRLNSRISELRKRGYLIECVRDTSKSGPEAYVYTLTSSSPQAPRPLPLEDGGQLFWWDNERWSVKA